NCCVGSHVAPALAPMRFAVLRDRGRHGTSSAPARRTSRPVAHTDCGTTSLPASATEDKRLRSPAAARLRRPATQPRSTVLAGSLTACSHLLLHCGSVR